MFTRNAPIRLTTVLAFVLGQASALWGLMVAVAYAVGFAVLLNGPADGPRLPDQIPAIGLAVGLAAGLIAWPTRDRVGRFALAGVVLNAIALAIAQALR